MPHSVSVERRSSGGQSFVPVPSGEAVLPGEPLRFVAKNAVGSERVRFVLTDSLGKVLLDRSTSTGLPLIGDSAYLDTTAPSAPGEYTLEAHADTITIVIGWFTHAVFTRFRVSPDAPPPPSSPPGGGGIAGGIGSITDLIKWLAIGAVVVYGAQALSSFRKK